MSSYDRERNPTLEPPSRQLQQVLLSKKLCTARELRRCASRVRRLTCDLPGFDSVWLDALVQRRVLTSFQARSIEASEYDRLAIGPSIVLDQIGQGPDSETFITRLPHERSTCIVKRVSVATELRGPTLKRLQRLIERGRTCQHAGVVIPHAARELPAANHSRSGQRSGTAARLATQTRLAVVSRPTEGLTLAQMLLRRGRLPDRIVLEITRQLLDAVAALHDSRIVHGEIRLDNLLLSSRGQVVLVDCGVRPAIRPAFEISAFVSPERNETIAPELIGTGDPATAASDLYAIGCVVWQLLAGRSAHPTGDPLAKLAAHQTERIPDVRDLAPETSARLAEAIKWLTSPNPNARPGHARELLNSPSSQKSDSKHPALGTPGHRSRTVLAGFAKQFHHPVARSSDPTRRTRTGRRLALATATMLIAFGALHLFSGRDTLPASIDRFGDWVQSQYADITSSAGSEANPSADAADSLVDDGLLPFPEPAADGTIEFPHAGPWRASTVIWPGARLVLRGRAAEPARIVIGTEVWQLRSAEVHLENLQIESAGTAPPSAGVIDCQSQILTLRRCGIRSTFDSIGARHNDSVLRWQALDNEDPLGGQVRISDCRFIGARSTLEVASPTRTLSCSGTLKLGGGPLFLIGPDAVPVSRTVDLNRVTVRGAQGVVGVRIASEHSAASRSRLELRTTDCVFALSPWQAQPGSLVTYIAQRLPHDWHQFLAVDGRGSVAAPGTRVVSLASPDATRRKLLDESSVSLRGLVSTTIEFRGTASFEPADSVVTRIGANRRSSDLPGISIDE